MRVVSKKEAGRNLLNGDIPSRATRSPRSFSRQEKAGRLQAKAGENAASRPAAADPAA